MPLAEPGPTKVLLAVPAEKRDRLRRILQGHRVVEVATRDEAMRTLGSDGFRMVVLGVHFDESQMFNVLADIRHPEQFPDDEAGNARVRRIIDYLILIDGDLHHVAQRTGDPVVTELVERRRAPR